MTRRAQAVAAWANYCRRFRIAPRMLVGLCYPGFEDFRVDGPMAREIRDELFPDCKKD